MKKVSWDLVRKGEFRSYQRSWGDHMGPRCPFGAVTASLKAIFVPPAHTAPSALSFQKLGHLVKLLEFIKWMKFVWDTAIQTHIFKCQQQLNLLTQTCSNSRPEIVFSSLFLLQVATWLQHVYVKWQILSQVKTNQELGSRKAVLWKLRTEGSNCPFSHANEVLLEPQSLTP